MNSKDILKADILDILFENRNKDYGAYALRREYPRRMIQAMTSVLGVFLLIFFFAGGKNHFEEELRVEETGPPLVVREIDTRDLLPPLPEPERRPQSQSARAERLFTSQVSIEPDRSVTALMPSFNDLATAVPSNRNSEGPNDDHIPVVPARPSVPVVPQAPVEAGAFIPDEREAEYPGGPEALKNFMASHLNTPEELQAGETKTVQVRFVIGPDGSASQFEIVKSGGYAFDQEVIRVCRKMSKWKPARQNGIEVKATLMIPVTFVGLEQ